MTPNRADVRSHDDCKALIHGTVHRFGQIDVMVRNAGTDIIKPVHSYKEPEWDGIVNTNLRGHYYYCPKFSAQVLLARGRGIIIMISSVSGEASVHIRCLASRKASIRR